MKKILNTILILVFIMGLSSCDKWLDVNTDPNNPNDSSAEVNVRLPWIQHYYMYAWGSASMRGSVIAGLYTINSTSNTNGVMASWNPTQSICTTVYQNWFLGGFVNIEPMIKKAEENGSYHYIGAAHCIRAMGFLLMLDLYGEIPFSEAGKIDNFAPAYDQGDAIYKSCMADLDKAIEYLEKDQTSATAIPLSKGDSWNGGSVDKWLKMCYGIKARYLLQISKKSIYKGDDVLAALANALQSNADNTIMKHYNVQGDAVNVTVMDPYQTNTIWDCIAYGSTQRATRWYANLLNNNYTGGSKVVDPRASKLLPAIMTNVKCDAKGKVLSNQWKRDVGVDAMNSDVREQGGPINASYAVPNFKTGKLPTIKYDIKDATAKAKFIAELPSSQKYTVTGNIVEVVYPVGSFYINSTNYKRAGDTAYVNTQSNSLATKGKSATDMYYYVDATAGAVAGSGSFYARPTSDSDIMTYSEMCFIKAEVLFRKGDKVGALAAYTAGIQANFDRMQTKLRSWEGEGTINPDQKPMNQADIAAYMASAAVVQNAADLTMAEIMKQKTISMGPNIQVWNDMRRLNYSAGNIAGLGIVYVDYKRPSNFTATNKITGASPTDPTYWFRRFSQSTHESNYNNKNLMASNPLAMKDAIWSDPVWWDKTE
ncbi:MAG: SusD/RagB family nutrient-binding outer membrane lipoprotein [Bacteroidales bacterium]